MSTETLNADRRRAILDVIRSGLNDGSPMKARQEAVAARLASQKPHLVPERANKDAAGLKAQFTQFLEGQTATVLCVAGLDMVPAALAGYLRSQNLPQRVRMGSDAELSGLPWSREPALTLDKGHAYATDEVSLSRAIGGISETGTLVMASGEANPVTLNYLPETHIVVLKASEIAGNYEAAFDKVRARFGRGQMPRTLNFISGPSRTADIGGRLVVGAHGPRRLCVIIVE